jgi:hypothetical protein
LWIFWGKVNIWRYCLASVYSLVTNSHICLRISRTHVSKPMHSYRAKTSLTIGSQNCQWCVSSSFL